MARRLNLKVARIVRGLTQAQVARKAGVSQQRLSQIEHGDGKSPILVSKLARVLGVPVEVLAA